MIEREVVFSPEARDDLRSIYAWIAAAAGEHVALGYVERLQRYCEGFEIGAERGHRRDDIRVGVRVAGFERRVAVAFTIETTSVTILRLLYGGQNWEEKVVNAKVPTLAVVPTPIALDAR